MIEKLKHMYQLEPEVWVVKKGQSCWNLNRFQTQSLQMFFKMVFLKILQISQENTCVWRHFLIKLQYWRVCSKETPVTASDVKSECITILKTVDFWQKMMKSEKLVSPGLYIFCCFFSESAANLIASFVKFHYLTHTW